MGEVACAIEVLPLTEVAEQGSTSRVVVIVDPVPEQMERFATELRSYGCSIAVCSPNGWANHSPPRPAAIILGPNLLPLETCDLCREIREQLAAPVIVLMRTADPGHMSLALDAGADYCVPGDLGTVARLMLSAVRALERRERLAHDARDGIIEAGPLRIDAYQRIVTLNGVSVPLTSTEFSILSLLARRPGRVIKASQILRHMHGYHVDEIEAQSIVKVHIWRLRQKLMADPRAPRCIVNVRGQGYMYMFERRQAAAAMNSHSYNAEGMHALSLGS